MKIKRNVFLFLIVVLSFILRVVKVSTIPLNLAPDEAALGYNSYLILKTGRDEYGRFLPLVLQSFGDFKPGLYSYFSIPFIIIFGLNEFAIRFLSVLSGTLAVFILFFLVEELARYSNLKNKDIFKLSLFSSFLLSITPWHIIFSRGAWEANFCLTLTLFGIYFFFKSFTKPHYLLLSTLFFWMTLFSYHGAKFSTPIVIFILIVLFWQKFLGVFEKKRVILANLFFITVLFAIFPLRTLFANPERLKVLSVFSYPRTPDYIEDSILKTSFEKRKSLSFYFFHSEGFSFLQKIIGRWLNHYSDDFLFIVGDWQNARHSSPYQGMFLISQILLLVFGFVLLARTRGKIVEFVILWALLSPLPAALTRDQVHAVRSFNLVIPLTILFSFGLLYLWNNFFKNLFWRLFFIFFIGLSFFSLVYFLDSYFVHSKKEPANLWGYGYKEISKTITERSKDYPYEFIGVENSYAQPYIYFLFYHPQTYHPLAIEREVNWPDVSLVKRLGDVRFGDFDYGFLKDRKSFLYSLSYPRYILNPSFKEFEVLEIIKYPNGQPAFVVIEKR